MKQIFKKFKKEKKEETLKKYKYKIIYKNKIETTGEGTTTNLDNIYEIFLANKFTYHNNNKKGTYYNSNEIIEFYVEEVEEENT